MATRPQEFSGIPQIAPQPGNGSNGGALFLSPEWVHSVVAAVEDAKRSDLYFQGLVAEFSLNVAYVVKNTPPALRSLYANAGQVVICVTLRRGIVEQVKLAGRLPSGPVDLIVTVDYGVAEKLFRGEVSPAATLLGGHVKAKAVNGFSGWSRVAAKSLVTAPRFLKSARKVATVFRPQTP